MEYLRVALALLGREGFHVAAGALIYEGAKQCINAVANQRRINPVATGAKRRFLMSLAETEADFSDLMLNWHAAELLHVNADRDNISRENFSDAWQRAQAFITQMRQIYYRSI
jgi:hypothetical protein